MKTSGEWSLQRHGDREHEEEVVGLNYMCPCGCGDDGYLPFRGIHLMHIDEHPSWIWDGNIESPTLTPSILRRGGCGWHGWLKAGKFISV